MSQWKKTAYDLGRESVYEALGLVKEAGYFQNVVGFDYVENVKALRDAARTSSDSLDEYYDQRSTGAVPERSTEELTGLGAPLRAFNPEGLKGSDFGYMGKYVEFPSMIGTRRTGGTSGDSTGEGYLRRQDLIKDLDAILTRKPLFKDRIIEPEYAEMRQALLDSPHEYVTSTDHG